MIREKVAVKEIVIDLTRDEGNANFLLAQVRRFAQYSRVEKSGFESDLDELFEMVGREDLVLSREEEIMEEMRSGDYEHLVETFDRHFGHFVILER
jgi:hypothetical protein